MNNIFSDLQEFESRLGLPPGFYSGLLEEDDWSFVVKLNALFEGACTHVLTNRLHASELANAFARLDFGNTKFGKVAMLRLLGVLSPDQESSLRKLAELRNDLVHDISNVAFTFDAHIAEFDANQRKAFVKYFGHGVKDTIEIGSRRISKNQFVCENPKLALWLTAAEIIACLYSELEVVELRLQKLALDEFKRLIGRSG